MMLRLFGIAVASALVVSAEDAMATRMNQLAEAKVSSSKFMGSILVARDGSVLFERSYGSANLEWNIPNAADTKFRLGSVSKQFTAAAILLLEERGRLGVQDPVSKFVPDAPAAWEKITLFHLLTHTSGIPNFTGFPEYATLKLSPLTPAKLVEAFRDRPLEFTPGEKFNYSNSGYVLLSAIIERVSGQSYAAFVQENIFKPLGMIDSGYDSNSAVIPRRAAGYVPSEEGPLNAPYIDMHVPLGAGALYSTTHDLLRWEQGLFGGKLLSAASLQKMTTPYKSDYAFGLLVHTAGGHKIIDHAGGIEGFNAQLSYYPETKLSVIVLANTNGSAPFELGSQLASVAFGESVKLGSERKSIEVPVETLQSYVGVYQLAPRITNTIRLVDGHLTTQLSGQRPLPIFAESETKFFLKVVDAQVEFFKDATGKVTHLVQYQAGREQKADRISNAPVPAP
jgi:CubicO group peptidase (beta-lactamase class C family)